MIPSIKITLLGAFKVTIDDIIVAEFDSRPGKNWEVFAILSMTRKSPLTTEHLVSFLWPEDVSVNPQNALKNAIYCLRRDINAACASEVDVIIYSGGRYQINPQIEVSVDIENIEAIYRSTVYENVSDSVSIKNYRRILELYGTGPVLTIASHPYSETWITRLKQMVITACIELARIFVEQNRSDECIAICKQGIEIDCYCAEIYKILLTAHAKQEQHSIVIEQYHRLNKLFTENVIEIPEDIEEIYDNSLQLISSLQRDIVMVRSEIKANLECSTVSKKAYFCTYDVFKHLANIKCREASRFGKTSALIMVGAYTISTEDQDHNGVVEAAMDSLKQTIGTCLRKGDVYARYSASQYVVMLVVDGLNNIEDVIIGRIQDRFAAIFKNKNVRLDTQFVDI